jgi:AcrR family transcriptional regulator
MELKTQPVVKEDARITRTKRDLVNALDELMQEKSYDDISVKDITDRAMISKNTFYNNFNEKNDLLIILFDRYAKDLMEENQKILAKKNPINKFSPYKKMIETTVHFLYTAKLPIFKLIKEDNSHAVYYMMNVFLQKSLEGISEYLGGYFTGSSRDLTTKFYSGAFVSVFYHSVLEDLKIKEADMVKNIVRLTLPLLS